MKTKGKITGFVLSFAVALQFFFIFCCNYAKAVDMLDYDASLAVRHAVEMWRHGTIFLPDFVYTTSMEIDCASFLAAPIYLLTGNYGLGLSLAHLFLDGVLAYLIYSLLKNMGVGYSFRMLGILLVFTPYEYGQLEWNNMLFLSVGQYEFRVICVLFLFLLLNGGKEEGMRKWIRFGICQAFLFLTVLSTGNYLLITAFAPLLLFEAVRILLRERIDWRDCGRNMLLCSAATAFCAFAINRAMHIDTVRSNMNIIKASEFSDNLLNCFTGILSLPGGLAKNDVSILSQEGIFYLVRFLFACILLFIVFTAFLRQKEIRKNRAFLGRFFFLFLINMFVFLFTNTRYGSELFEVRYHIVWFILLIITDVMLISQVWNGIGRWMRNFLAGCIAAGILIMNFSGFSVIWNKTGDGAQIIERTLAAADANELNDIIVVDEVISRKVGAIDINKNVQYAEIGDENGSFAFISWGTFANISVAPEHLLVIKEEDFLKMSDELKNAYREVDGMEEWHILTTGADSK